MKLKWFFSGAVRNATDMSKHVRKLLNAQRDILSPQAIDAVTASLTELQGALDSGAADEVVTERAAKLEEVANKWIKPYPFAEWRENVEVFLVAIAVAMAIRTFFLQPFKIPTGSMEPTLFGVELTDLREDPGFHMPNVLQRTWDLIYYGETYHDIVAARDGEVTRLAPVQTVAVFFNKQTFWVRYKGEDREVPVTIWCGPDGRPMDRAGHMSGVDREFFHTPFNQGESILCFKETTGDHLFVDRVTYNFRHPRRGDIIVFKTQGIAGIPDQSQFYIKRLVGLPGETVSIGNDQHARINGRRLDASTPHFENIYGFDTNAPPGEARDGHWNGHILQDRPDSLLRSPQDSITIEPGHYLVFGDNTRNSLDSRYWGTLPQENVIGKSFFVYWPFSHRFGWNSIEY